MRRPSLARTLIEGGAYALGAAVVTGALFVAAGACATTRGAARGTGGCARIDALPATGRSCSA